MEFLHCKDPDLCWHAGFCGGNTGRLSTFFAPVTLTLTRWPTYMNWPVLPGDIPDVQICTFCVKAFESYCVTDRHADRQTESTEIINHAVLRVVNKLVSIPCHWNACLCHNSTATFVHSWWRPLSTTNTNYNSEMNIENNDPDLWPLTWKTFSALPTHKVNVHAMFHWNHRGSTGPAEHLRTTPRAQYGRR